MLCITRVRGWRTGTVSQAHYKPTPHFVGWEQNKGDKTLCSGGPRTHTNLLSPQTPMFATSNSYPPTYIPSLAMGSPLVFVATSLTIIIIALHIAVPALSFARFLYLHHRIDSCISDTHDLLTSVTPILRRACQLSIDTAEQHGPDVDRLARDIEMSITSKFPLVCHILTNHIDV